MTMSTPVDPSAGAGAAHHHSSVPAAQRPHRAWQGVALALAALIVLGGTFAAYLRPDMAFTLANQLWSCF
jgi:hypothetical protein